MRFQFITTVDFAITAAGSGAFAFSLNWPVGGLSQVLLGYAGVNCEETDTALVQVSAFIQPRIIGGTPNTPQYVPAITSGDGGGVSSAAGCVAVFNNFMAWEQEVMFNVPNSGALFSVQGFLNAPTLVDAVTCKFTFGFVGADGKDVIVPKGNIDQFKAAESLRTRTLKDKFIFER